MKAQKFLSAKERHSGCSLLEKLDIASKRFDIAGRKCLD
jgi:hypothetical protein